MPSCMRVPPRRWLPAAAAPPRSRGARRPRSGGPRPSRSKTAEEAELVDHDGQGTAADQPAAGRDRLVAPRLDRAALELGAVRRRVAGHVDRLVPRVEDPASRRGRPAPGPPSGRVTTPASPRPASPGPTARAGRGWGAPRGRAGDLRRPSASKNRSGGRAAGPSPGRVLDVDEQALAGEPGPRRRPRPWCGPCPRARRSRRAWPAAARRPSRRRPPHQRDHAVSRWPTRRVGGHALGGGVEPEAAHSRFHRPSLPTVICTAPSRQWNRPYGVIDGWWLPWARPTSRPRPARVPGRRCTPTVAASSEVRHDRADAGAVALVAARRARRRRPRTCREQVGDRHADALRVPGPERSATSGQPRPARLVVARAPALGPVVAEAVIDSTTSRGLRCWSSSKPSPSRSRTPVRKFSTRTSARSTSCSSTSRSASP